VLISFAQMGIKTLPTQVSEPSPHSLV